jgi:hypothetical protein
MNASKRFPIFGQPPGKLSINNYTLFEVCGEVGIFPKIKQGVFEVFIFYETNNSGILRGL